MFIKYKIHPIYDHLYCFSDGRILSITANRFLTQKPKKNGYIQINVNRMATKSAHRLISEAFFGISDLYVNHKNGKKNDNSISNLEYVTAKENTNHAIATGLFNIRDVSGEKNPCAKINKERAEEIRAFRISTKLSYYKIAKEFDLSEMTVSNICRNKSWI